MRVKISRLQTFSREAIATWASANLLPGCDVRSDGPACFAGLFNAGCAHSYSTVAHRKPRDLPQFTWVKTVLGDLKTIIGGSYKVFKLRKYADICLGAFAYRLNRRYKLPTLFTGLVRQAATTCPTTAHGVMVMAKVHD